MELVGKLLGNRYEILEMIGKGGMATVYKAKDKTLNRNVAVKVLKDEFANDQEFIRRFQIEAQSAAALSHPNIVSIYDVSNDGDIHYIVMELIEGKTLKDVINEKGKLPWQEACKIASQIASGLSVAHKNHIIHRDIKPHNIVMTKDNLAKITDFGIAKAASSSTINANSNSLGSVHYFSPEHARGGYTDEKSDIYSLGVVLYEMVTGKLPFDGDTAVSIAMKHLKDDPEEPIKIVPDIPRGLNYIILKAMQREVGSRYLTASDMYKDIQKILQSPESTSVGHVNSKDEVFATQKVPIVNKQMASRTVNSTQKEDTNKKTIKKKKRKSPIQIILTRLLIVIILFAAVVGITVLLMNNMFGNNKEMKVVPGVIGNSYESAKQKLEAAGFQVDENVRKEESSLPKDYVIEQSVHSGDMAEVNKKITLTVSSGMKTIEMVDLTGYSETAAISILVEKGLRVDTKEEQSTEDNAGKVLRQSPKAGEVVYPGDTTVTIYVGAGGETDKVKVPDLSRYSEEGAIETLEALELGYEKFYASNSGETEGKILWQSPEADKEVDVGTIVKFYINKFNIKNNTSGGVIEIAPENKPDETKPSTSTNTNTNTNDNEEYKVMSIILSNLGKKEKFTIRVELDGDIKGRSLILPDEEHTRSEKILNVRYPADATGMLRVYVDNELSSEQVID
ncbi:MAG: Stk1 family PASTA domain-containing Ser/Thr kinase [Clostridia bacterium]|nr:Stk1 family PASTA domain-containing Ser/Thr kinase [Clostridia bacterium]